MASRNGETRIVSLDLTGTAAAFTREVRIEEKSAGGDSDKILDVDAAGALAVTTITRFGGMHHHHH